MEWYLDFKSCYTASVFKGRTEFKLGEGLNKFLNVFSDVSEMFFKVKHGIDVDHQHFVGFVGWEIFI
jgi:hypothetical protein